MLLKGRVTIVGTHHDRQRSERRDEHSRADGVCDEIEDLAEDHHGHAAPPERVLEVGQRLAGLRLILALCRQETALLEDKRGTNEEAAADSKGQTEPLHPAG